MTVALMGIFANSMLLYSDLKNPNYTWNNISEITKNNKRIMKPMSRKILASLPECHMETDVPLAMVPGRLREFYGIEKPEHP